MSDVRGDVVTIKAIGLSRRPQVPSIQDVFNAPDAFQCCYKLPLFGSLLDPTNELKNDKTRFYRGYDAGTTLVTMFLTKPSDPTFTEIALVDDTYGTFFEFGFFIDEETGNRYIGYEMDWVLILDAFGEGSYQVKTYETKLFGPIVNDFDFQYCLANFTTRRADGTMVLHFNNSHRLKDRFRQDANISFPYPTFDGSGNVLNAIDVWPDSIRVWGYFGYDKSAYEEEVYKFKNQSFQQRKQRQVFKHKIRIDHAPSEVHEKIQTEFCQADFKTVTDYNRNNYKRHIGTAVIKPSEYEPQIEEDLILAWVEVEFESYWDFGNKDFC